MDKVVLIYSGGIDSTVLLYKLLHEGSEVFPLGFDYGQRHVRELLHARQICNSLGLLYVTVKLNALRDLCDASLLRQTGSIPDGRAAVVPNRNAVMLSLATTFAVSNDIDAVALAVHKSDYADFPDCRPEFLEAFEKAMQLATERPSFRILAPFLSLTKSEIVKMGVELRVPFEKTWTCYNPRFPGLPCGECPACLERRKAFEANGIRDPLQSLTER